MAQLVSLNIIIIFFAKKFKLFFRKPEIPVVVVAVVKTIIVLVIKISLIF